jgi:site-specific recombinase XerD
MDKPADPSTPFGEVYQSFLDDLALEGTKPSTIHRYRYNIVRFEKWLVANGHPAILASLERTLLIAYRQHLENLPQQPRGSTRRRRGGLMSRHTVHSYLRSIKCLASWLKGAGHLDANPFLAINAYYKKKGVMPVLQADDRISKIGKPSDVATLLTGCAGDEPEDLRDRALVWLLYSSGIRAADAVELTIPAVDFETGVLFIEDGKGDKDRQAFISPIAAEHIRAYLDHGRTPLLKRMPKRHGPVPAGAASRSNLLATDVLFLSSRAGRARSGSRRRASCRSSRAATTQPAERCRHSVLTACATAWRPKWPNRASTSARSSAGAAGQTSKQCRSTYTWTPPAFAPSRTGSKDLCSTSSRPKHGRRSRKRWKEALLPM